MPIKGIIFDFDGTILDSEVPEYEAWVEIYKQYGATLPINDWAACIGSSNDAFDVIAYLEGQYKKKVDAIVLNQLQRKMSDERTAHQQALPGVVEVLRQAKQLGLQTAIASSSPREWVQSNLARLDLARFFEIICTADDVVQVKPDPELFLCAAQKMGLEPKEVLVFEDSPHGISAALCAGMLCIAVPNEITRHLDTSHATRSFISMAEIHLENLMISLDAS